MDSLHMQKLTQTIDALSRIANLSNESKQQLLDKYSVMSDVDIIKDLAISIYRVLGSDSPYYDYALSVVRNYNSSICPKVDEMKIILDKMFSNQTEGNMSLEQNHELAKESLIKFCSLFNQYGIDYYIVGALPCFLKTNQPLFRYHDDIDIMVNEDDISKIKEILENTNYEFYDDRFPSLERFYEMQENTPPHTILAQNKENEFHLGFFCFRRENDNSITMREYSHRLENGEVAVDVKERLSNPLSTALQYDENPMSYNGVSFKTCSIENVYKLKQYTKRLKDITDMKKLEPYVDKHKLLMLQEQKNRDVVIQNVTSEKSIYKV